MDISSPPEGRTYQVIDLDIGFLSGDVKQFTIYEMDTIDETPETILLVLHLRDQHLAIIPEQMERLTIYKAGVAWTSRRNRTFQVIPQSASDGKPIEGV